MARKRMMDPNFWMDEKVGMVDPMARLTFMGLISQADDEGRMGGHPALIKSQVFPYDAQITPDQVREWLGYLEEKELIQQYTVAGQLYISLPNFLKHQKINRPTPSKLPGPEQTETEDKKQLTESSVRDHEPIMEPSRPIEVEENRKEEKGSRKEHPSTTADWLHDLESDMHPDAKQVADHYAKRRETLVVGSKDFTLIETFFDQHTIPLADVITGIDYAFDHYKPATRGGGIKSFNYCIPIILEQYDLKNLPVPMPRGKPIQPAVNVPNSEETRAQIDELLSRRSQLQKERVAGAR
ncbi:hypothetical protein SAMN05444487_11847 [Marininema mesophilum]|uniref:Uncharacterized protein n=1 Tax=Marininema mesophilum TaxID=1048340 RepID=A0A1H3BVG3_9BACL|nr:hypothetical protein [Marininema mesophilum]SDX45816.1 hypothetical protein SAMN05444487_11847 [Marininema mesophilum]